MKKISVFLFAVLLSFTLIGCQSQENIATPLVITEKYESKFDNISYEECNYILNMNTGKFHYKNCYATRLMSEKNKVYCNDEKISIIEHGYIPCLRCNP